MATDIVINGRVLLLPMNGIPRYAHEVIRRLDETLARKCRVQVVIPDDADTELHYRNIPVVRLPAGRGWDFFAAEKYARKQHALYINLASKGVLYRNSITAIHDIRLLSYEKSAKDYRTLVTKVKSWVSFVLATRRAGHIVTVSEVSKAEILEHSGLSAEQVTVIGNGWEHMTERSSDSSVFADFPAIRKGDYYLSVSSIAPHKNFDWIIQNARRNPDEQYVIVGKTDTKLWADSTDRFIGNVIYTGYQTDESIKALLENAKGLIFPSLYEGFGIPPLEAMACGVKALVSDIPVMHEIFGDSVLYLDPHNADVDLKELSAGTPGSADPILEKHSWKNAAKKWEELIVAYQEERK